MKKRNGRTGSFPCAAVFVVKALQALLLPAGFSSDHSQKSREPVSELSASRSSIIAV